MSLTDGRMAIDTGATGSRRIIEVEELGQRGACLLDIFERLVTCGKDVARIYADAKTLIVDVCDEAGEGLLRKEHFTALTGRSLQEDGASGCGVMQGL